MSDSITLRFQGQEYIVPVEYRPKFGADHMIPLLTEMLHSMFAMAIITHRRALGHPEGGTLSLSFQAENFAGDFARAWARIESLRALKD